MNAPERIPHPDRTRFIGGSDCAAILGVSPWKTTLQLFMEKTGQYTEEITPAKQRIFDRGHRWEPVVVEMVVDELQARGHDVEILARNERYVDPKFPFLACELDLELRVDGEDVNGEMKTVHPFAAGEWGAPESDEVPIYYAAQVAHGLMIVPRRRTLVAALIGVDDLRIHWIERDEETIAAIREREIEFWARVQTGEAPPATTPEDMKLLYRRDGGQVMDADEDLLEWCQQAKDMKAQANELETRLEALTTRIKGRMGACATLLGPDGKPLATWKNNKDSMVTDWKALVHHHWPVPPADLVEQFTTTKPGARPFLIK